MMKEDFEDNPTAREIVEKDRVMIEKGIVALGYAVWREAGSMPNGPSDSFYFRISFGKTGRQTPDFMMEYKAKWKASTGQLIIGKKITLKVYNSTRLSDISSEQIKITREQIMPFLEGIVGKEIPIDVDYRFPNPETKITTVSLSKFEVNQNDFSP